jgi:hypothetical protein
LLTMIGATVGPRRATKRWLAEGVAQWQNVVAQNPELVAVAHIVEVQDTPELARRVAPEIARRTLLALRRAPADQRNKSKGRVR